MANISIGDGLERTAEQEAAFRKLAEDLPPRWQVEIARRNGRLSMSLQRQPGDSTVRIFAPGDVDAAVACLVALDPAR